ncbi:MAG: flagellar biosynthetic protein FliO [Comamonadaceae bacterium CG_4_9_14_3_um_filter_60_33]|nr:MAG: flagellar biosynthetic protein FliO [Comamonadaceae bacterium CG2_30_59_20]PIY29790.1 MAG: flagellar biosynthetic protein FliO [Comamonadaceae bacterium CG_4_10_14_3_um_filter_60_42]PJB43643.1 MAG: flagellar biosynthetic protein FliO [Comamonadaceae bacterium CG_4_9_14_3_um_filter_60_33]
MRTLWLLAVSLTGLSFPAVAVLPTVPAAAPAEAVPSYAAAGLLQAGLGLALVLALIFLFAWLVRRFGLPGRSSDRLLKVVSSVMVGQRERVVVVEVGNSWLVLGVAAGQVSALHTMPAEKLVTQGSAQPAPTALAEVVFSRNLRESLQRMGLRGKSN